MSHHTGTKQVFNLVRLPKSWNYMDGLRFPLTITKTNGKILIFNSYSEYHEFIKKTFKPSQNT